MNLWQMSLSGAVLIMAITVIRAVLINKLPKKTFLFLWGLALLRLLVPFSIPFTFSFYSLFNTNTSVSNAATYSPITGLLQMSASVTVVAPDKSIPVSSGSIPFSWEMIRLLGCMVFAAIFVVCYLTCLKNFKTSLPISTDYIQDWLKEHKIRRNISVRQSDRISSPLTYGIFRPVILLPKSVDLNNRQQLSYIFQHEFVHICRFDLLTKIVATATLCIHWFNPFVWVLYLLLNRDLELACDEAVIRKSDKLSRADYARTLISLEEHRSVPSLLFSNFSKNVMEERIVAIMKPKKFTLLGAVGALTLVVLIATGFLTSAQAAEPNQIPDTTKSIDQNETAELEAQAETIRKDNAEPETATGNDVSATSSLKIIWPTESISVSLTYGNRVHPLTGEIKAVDHICIQGEKGDNIYAAISGTVTESTFDTEHGNYVIITNADGLTTIYAHLQDTFVAVSDTVTAGDVIGTLGATGMATGPNLAFSVVVNGTPVDPMSYFE